MKAGLVKVWYSEFFLKVAGTLAWSLRTNARLKQSNQLKRPLAKSNLEKGLFNIFFWLAVLFSHEDCA